MFESVFDQSIIRAVRNLCPGCGADNMPSLMEILIGNAIWICPVCKRDRTPEDINEDEFY